MKGYVRPPILFLWDSIGLLLSALWFLLRSVTHQPLQHGVHTRATHPLFFSPTPYLPQTCHC